MTKYHESCVVATTTTTALGALSKAEPLPLKRECMCVPGPLTHPLSSFVPSHCKCCLSGRTRLSGWGSSAHGTAGCGRAEPSTAASVSGAAFRPEVTTQEIQEPSCWPEESYDEGKALMPLSPATREEDRCPPESCSPATVSTPASFSFQWPPVLRNFRNELIMTAWLGGVGYLDLN